MMIAALLLLALGTAWAWTRWAPAVPRPKSDPGDSGGYRIVSDYRSHRWDSHCGGTVSSRHARGIAARWATPPTCDYHQCGRPAELAVILTDNRYGLFCWDHTRSLVAHPSNGGTDG